MVRYLRRNNSNKLLLLETQVVELETEEAGGQTIFVEKGVSGGIGQFHQETSVAGLNSLLEKVNVETTKKVHQSQQRDVEVPGKVYYEPLLTAKKPQISV